MILQDKDLLDNFCGLFNSRLTPVELILSLAKGNSSKEHATKQMIYLQFNSKQLLNQLEKHSYIDLLTAIVHRVQIEPSCADIFTSELDERLFNNYCNFLLNHREQVQFSIDEANSRITMVGADLFLDTIIDPISQFHIEVQQAYTDFNEYIKITGTPDNLFLNANSPSAFSQFIQMWVAENLGIPLNLGGQYMVG